MKQSKEAAFPLLLKALPPLFSKISSHSSKKGKTTKQGCQSGASDKWNKVAPSPLLSALSLFLKSLTVLRAVTAFEMQITASRRQPEEQRTIEERWKNGFGKGSLNFPWRGGDMPMEGSSDEDLGQFHGTEKPKELRADAGVMGEGGREVWNGSTGFR